MKSLPKNLLEALLRTLPDGILVASLTNDEWRTVYFNPAFGELSGLSAGELSGQALHGIVEKLGAPDDWPRIAAALADREPLYLTVYPGTPDEAGAPLSLCVSTLESGRSRGIFANCRLSSRHGETRAADGPPSPAEPMPYAEPVDAATGLVPRAFFDGVLAHDWALARREGNRVSLLVYRIDAFEAYLGTFGRHATESMVRRVSRCITRRLRRESDIAARLEEDCIVALVHGGDETGVLGFAQSVAGEVKALGIHHPRSPVDRYLTVQCDVHAALPEAGGEPSDLIMGALAAAAPGSDDSGSLPG